MAIDPLADAGPTRQRLVTIDEVADYLDYLDHLRIRNYAEPGPECPLVRAI